MALSAVKREMPTNGSSSMHSTALNSRLAVVRMESRSRGALKNRIPKSSATQVKVSSLRGVELQESHGVRRQGGKW
jgi:hypothetical protein